MIKWHKLQKWLSSLQTILGAPNYEQYVHYMKQTNPHHPIQSEKDFYRQMLDKKYNSGKANRCC